MYISCIVEFCVKFFQAVEKLNRDDIGRSGENNKSTSIYYHDFVAENTVWLIDGMEEFLKI